MFARNDKPRRNPKMFDVLGNDQEQHEQIKNIVLDLSNREHKVNPILKIPKDAVQDIDIQSYIQNTYDPDIEKKEFYNKYQNIIEQQKLRLLEQGNILVVDEDKNIYSLEDPDEITQSLIKYDDLSDRNEQTAQYFVGSEDEKTDDSDDPDHAINKKSDYVVENSKRRKIKRIYTQRNANSYFNEEDFEEEFYEYEEDEHSGDGQEVPTHNDSEISGDDDFDIY